MKRKVTLLGDSIRLMGYGAKVSELLGDGFQVFQTEDNCRFAKYTLRMLFDFKKNIEGSEVIHWNNGLWDVCNLFGDGTFSTLEEYVQNMLRIADILLKITPNVIFATTTPVADDYPYQTNDDIVTFNVAIVPLLKEKGIFVNDLFATVYPNRERYICEDKIHLSQEGAEVCSKQVYNSILSLLNK